MPIIAVILTCHNRRDTTVRCLLSLSKCRLPAQVSGLKLYITDDGCTDGTVEAVLSLFPDAIVTPGTGELFWGGGMRCSMLRAMADQPEFILWLNDDVVLYEHALLSAFDALEKDPTGTLIIGATEEEHGCGRVSYGGVRRKGAVRSMSFELVQPGKGIDCHTMNGQFVLLPACVFQKLGAIDARFRHTGGDFDYGYRARQAGFGLMLVPEFVGYCGRGPSLEEKLRHKNCKQYWTTVLSPLGLPPDERFEFCRRHAGLLWFFHWLWPYLKLALAFPRITSQ